MNLRKDLPVAIACAVVLAGCGYIVTPADESTPAPSAVGAWTAVATGVAPADAGTRIDLAIRNDTGAWSAMQAPAGTPATLTAGDGTSTACATVSVGTGGTYLAPGFQVRGYTGGTKAKPETQLLHVDCPGAAPAAGARLSIPYGYVSGEFNYYTPPTPAQARLEVDLDKVAADLTYPVAATVEGVIEAADTKIDAINHVTLTLSGVTRTGDGLELAWKADNPTDYPTYLHIGTPSVVGSDGVIYGFYESPHLAIPPLAPAHQAAAWTTKVAVPKDVTGLYILPSVETKQQKNFASHAIDITGE